MNDPVFPHWLRQSLFPGSVVCKLQSFKHCFEVVFSNLKSAVKLFEVEVNSCMVDSSVSGGHVEVHSLSSFLFKNQLSLPVVGQAVTHFSVPTAVPVAPFPNLYL